MNNIQLKPFASIATLNNLVGRIVPTHVLMKKGTVESIVTKFVWEIKDFANPIPPNAIIIVSPTFNALNFNFDLTLNPNLMHGGETHIRIEVRALSVMSEPYPSIKISFLNDENSDGFEHVLHWMGNICRTNNIFNRKSVMNEYAKYGTLRVVCTVMTRKYVTVDAAQAAPRKRLKLCLETMDSFKKLFNKEELSDAVFCVEGRNIYVQKSILICKSPVFAAMFSGDNLENKTNKVEIVDNTYDSMYVLLEYIYTGLTDEHLNLDCATCLGVLIGAEKYNLEFLKEKFQKIICQKFTTDNVLECLVIADSNNAAHLKQKCINYIVSKSQDICKSGSFKEFLLSYTDLSCEIFNAMSLKIINV